MGDFFFRVVIDGGNNNTNQDLGVGMDLYKEIHQALRDIKNTYNSSSEICLYLSDEFFSEIKGCEWFHTNIDTINDRIFGYRFFIVSSFHGHKRVNAAIY